MKRLFVKALENIFEMKREDARDLAKTVEEVFHGEKEIEDMTIDKYTRSLFYELHVEKLLDLDEKNTEKKENIYENITGRLTMMQYDKKHTKNLFWKNHLITYIKRSHEALG